MDIDINSLPEKLIAKAETELKKWRWFHPEKYENAASFFQRAAMKYKLKKQYIDAGNTFIRASKCYFEDEYEKYSFILDAGRCFLNCDLTKAEECFKQTGLYYENNTSLQKAGSLYEELADHLLKNKYSYESVINYYKRSSDMYEAANLTTGVIKTRSKIGYLFATNNKYFEAVETFNTIIDMFITIDNSKKYYAKLFSDSILCCLCMEDIVKTQQNITKYQIVLPSLVNDYRWKMIIDIVEAVKSNNLTSFQEMINKHQTYNMIDEWTVNILTVIQNQLKYNSNENDEDDLC